MLNGAYRRINSMITLTVKSGRVGPIRGRHPWVFSGALKHIPEGLASGDPVTLADEQGNFLALGYFNSYSQIAVRLWSWEKDEEVNKTFFEQRIRQAYELRQQFVASKETNAFRLVHAENDLLPGLIVDKYGDYLSLQFHTPGMERWKKEIVNALVKIVKPQGIYERSDVRVRGIEGAEKKVGLLYGDMPERVEILENGFKFYVDIISGQKTGFFLDQRDKRQALTKYVKNKKVLNCFSYTGGFSVYALGAGASQVVSVDASQSALELAEQNVKLNKLPEKKCEFILADVKEYLGDLTTANHPSPFLGKEGMSPVSPPVPKGSLGGTRGGAARAGRGGGSNQFDVIILDPPAFVKDRHKIKEGLQGYRKINELALRALPPGGTLLTCSCSAHVSLQDFRFMLTEAASRAGRTVQILEMFTHGIDHPELVAFTEGEYLKCLIALVI